MEPKIIVMIVTLALPNGDSGVHVKPMANVAHCIAEASIEASDPFVRNVECSELDNGRLMLDFKVRPDDEDGDRKKDVAS
ncbi:MAG: hypothetical protein AB7E80_15080 [Hyphomicrobiaceae bacterium]